MQIRVIEKNFKLAGDDGLKAQFTFITSGTVHIWFPETGLQMEAHHNQLCMQNNTLIYTDGLHHGQHRALWALTLHDEDITEFKEVMSLLKQQPHHKNMYKRKQPGVVA